MEIYIPMEGETLLQQNLQLLKNCEKEEEESYLLADCKRSYFPNFSLVLSANMY